ncbi:MAG: prolipoprotein diacylglyceryl transferase [Candidatus Nanoarchaeia archaeon]|nr:prolipoprotein diacylglyceryl transferase [Candidatus Nanoarchaeia archaeon]
MYIHNLNPIMFDLGFTQIRWYGFMYFISSIIIFLLLKKINKKKFIATDIEDLCFHTILGLIIGGRIFYYLIYNFNIFINNPFILIDFRHGGFSFHGALFGVFLGVIIFSLKDFRKYLFLKNKTQKKNKIILNENLQNELKKNKIILNEKELKSITHLIKNDKNDKKIVNYFFRIADYLSLLFPIGLFFGRIGNFINSELFGRPTTNEIIGVIFKGESILRHPSQLYEAFFEGLILFFLLLIFYKKIYFRKQICKKNFIKKENNIMENNRIENNKIDNNGIIFILFLIGYSIFRFSIEFFREPDVQLGFFNILKFNISMGQILSLIMFLFGILFFYLLFINKKLKEKINNNYNYQITNKTNK